MATTNGTDNEEKSPAPPARPKQTNKKKKQPAAKQKPLNVPNGKTAAAGKRKASGDPQQPATKRFKSAYMFFSIEKQQEFAKMLENEPPMKRKATNVAKLVAAVWREMGKEEREPWEEMSRRDKARYEAERSIKEGTSATGSRKKAKRDPTEPKRPMSAYLAFSNSRRAMVKRQNPHFTNGEVSKKLAKMWREAPKNIKQEYIDEEAKLRKEYMNAMKEWRKGNANKKKAGGPQEGEQPARAKVAPAKPQENRFLQSDDDKKMPAAAAPPKYGAKEQPEESAFERQGQHGDSENTSPEAAAATASVGLLGLAARQSPADAAASRWDSMQNAANSAQYQAASSMGETAQNSSSQGQEDAANFQSMSQTQAQAQAQAQASLLSSLAGSSFTDQGFLGLTRDHTASGFSHDDSMQRSALSEAIRNIGASRAQGNVGALLERGGTRDALSGSLLDRGSTREALSGSLLDRGSSRDALNVGGLQFRSPLSASFGATWPGHASLQTSNDMSTRGHGNSMTSSDILAAGEMFRRQPLPDSFRLPGLGRAQLGGNTGDNDGSFGDLLSSGLINRSFLAGSLQGTGLGQTPLSDSSDGRNGHVGDTGGNFAGGLFDESSRSDSARANRQAGAAASAGGDGIGNNFHHGDLAALAAANNNTNLMMRAPQPADTLGLLGALVGGQSGTTADDWRALVGGASGSSGDELRLNSLHSIPQRQMQQDHVDGSRHLFPNNQALSFFLQQQQQEGSRQASFDQFGRSLQNTDAFNTNDSQMPYGSPDPDDYS